MGHRVSVYTTDCLDNNSFMSLRHGRHSDRTDTWNDQGISVYPYRPVVIPYIQKHSPVLTYGPIIPQCLIRFTKEESRSEGIVHAMAFPYAHNAFAYMATELSGTRMKIIFSPWLKESSRIPRYLAKLLRRADAVIAQTESEKKVLAGLLRDVSKVHILPAGVGPEFEPSARDRERLRAEIGLSPDLKLLLFAGRMTREKGFFDVLQAFKMLPEDFFLLILGRADARAKEVLRSEAQLLGGRLLAPGYVPDRSLPSYFNAAELVLYPSADDSFGMVFLEAMRTGKTPIGCPIGGPKELLRPGWDSEVTPFGQPATLAAKIIELFESPKRLKMMGARGRARVRRRYDWSEITRNLLGIYETALSR